MRSGEGVRRVGDASCSSRCSLARRRSWRSGSRRASSSCTTSRRRTSSGTCSSPGCRSCSHSRSTTACVAPRRGAPLGSARRRLAPVPAECAVHRHGREVARGVPRWLDRVRRVPDRARRSARPRARVRLDLPRPDRRRGAVRQTGGLGARVGSARPERRRRLPRSVPALELVGGRSPSRRRSQGTSSRRRSTRSRTRGRSRSRPPSRSSGARATPLLLDVPHAARAPLRPVAGTGPVRPRERAVR